MANNFLTGEEIFDDLFGGFRFSKPKSNFILDQKNRIKFDPDGNFIKKKDRLKLKKFLRNPFGITAGNAILPFTPEVPNFLAGLETGGSNPVSNILRGLTNNG